MIIPYGINAPLYHWPLGTIVLMALNILASVAGWLGKTEIVLLDYGNGLHPVQWVASLFFHSSIVHLLGNMFFLWIFGLVVEGKIGVFKFVPCYFAIGVLQCAIEQIVMLGYGGPSDGSLGASAVLYGLMMMAVIWAPKNEISCILVLLWRSIDFEISVAMVGAWYLGWELFDIWTQGIAASSALLHLSGALIGGAIGLLMLKFRLVDCDGWDILAVFGNQEGVPLEERMQKQEQEPAETTVEPLFTDAAARSRLAEYLEAGNADAALRLREKIAAAGRPLELEPAELIALIRLLHEAARWRESAPLMAEFVQRQLDGADRVCLKLAQICVQHLNRPSRALELVTDLDGASLAEPLQRARKQIVARAEKMQRDGVFELDDEQW